MNIEQIKRELLAEERAETVVSLRLPLNQLDEIREKHPKAYSYLSGELTARGMGDEDGVWSILPSYADDDGEWLPIVAKTNNGVLMCRVAA